MTKRTLRRIATAVAASVALITGCSEPYASTIVQSPTPGVEAVLVVSDLTSEKGSAVLVSVKTTSTVGVVGSYTARIKYDSTALRFDGEVPLDDQALRAVNPKGGQVRFAGASAKGFASGRLAEYRFVVLRADGVKTLSLVVDEMHILTSADAKSNLTIAPIRSASR